MSDDHRHALRAPRRFPIRACRPTFVRSLITAPNLGVPGGSSRPVVLTD